jgi:hypothetical protein
MFLGMVQLPFLFSQGARMPVDSIMARNDTIVADTLVKPAAKASANAIEEQITYSAAGYAKVDMVKKTATLVKTGKVTYGDITLEADSIVLNMESGLIYAAGIKDTTGAIVGTPKFSEGSQEFESKELTYNYKTKKAFIRNIVTHQDQGILHSAVTKLLEDGTSNVAKSMYTTCEAEHPHFYVNLPKAKLYPGKRIVSGPANLVLEGIPLPLFLPFGYFPFQKKTAASGLLIPRIGQENQRGYSLTDGGYYFAISDYFDLALKGNLYTNGTWMLTAQTNYNKLYKYNGNFNFSYANNVSGHKGLPDFSKSYNYRLGWMYNQNAKARPGSRFSASVNMSSSEFDRTNSYVVSDHVTTQRQSSVSYSKTWEGTPFNLSTSVNHSQNVRNKTISLNLPKLNFNVGRIYPLKRKNSTGPARWWQELQFQYSTSLDNQINTYDSLLFTRQVWRNMRNGFKHDAPLSFQIRPFRNFNISPQVSYSGVLYTQKIEKTWDPEHYNEVLNTTSPAVVIDTAHGFFYGQSINPSISASYNPQIFGMFLFTNPNSRLQAVRHVIKPSVGFSFVPSVSGLSSNMYRQVQSDTTGRMSEYSIFEGNIFGTPSLSRRSGSISFSLVNIVEAKVFEKNDTTGKPKKVKIIDNFGITTSYNIFADSMHWAPVNMNMRTTLMENVNISASSNFSLYGLNSRGMPTGTFAYEQNGKLMRLTNFSVSLDFDLTRLLSGKNQRDRQGSSAMQQGQPAGMPGAGRSEPSPSPQAGSGFDEYGYAAFDIPWTFNVRYNLYYTKPGLVSNLSQTLSFDGNMTLTKKTTVNFTSGYDFARKEITMTRIGINRDLHCWEMSFNWIPNGTMKSWDFTLRVKASVLQDLKYERRKDYHDQY